MYLCNYYVRTEGTGESGSQENKELDLTSPAETKNSFISQKFLQVSYEMNRRTGTEIHNENEYSIEKRQFRLFSSITICKEFEVENLTIHYINISIKENLACSETFANCESHNHENQDRALNFEMPLEIHWQLKITIWLPDSNIQQILTRTKNFQFYSQESHWKTINSNLLEIPEIESELHSDSYNSKQLENFIFETEIHSVSDSTLMTAETEQFLYLANSETNPSAYLILFNNAIPLNLISLKLKPFRKFANPSSQKLYMFRKVNANKLEVAVKNQRTNFGSVNSSPKFNALFNENSDIDESVFDLNKEDKVIHSYYQTYNKIFEQENKDFENSGIEMSPRLSCTLPPSSFPNFVSGLPGQKTSSLSRRNLKEATRCGFSPLPHRPKSSLRNKNTFSTKFSRSSGIESLRPENSSLNLYNPVRVTSIYTLLLRSDVSQMVGHLIHLSSSSLSDTTNLNSSYLHLKGVIPTYMKTKPVPIPVDFLGRQGPPPIPPKNKKQFQKMKISKLGKLQENWKDIGIEEDEDAEKRVADQLQRVAAMTRWQTCVNLTAAAAAGVTSPQMNRKRSLRKKVFIQDMKITTCEKPLHILFL